MAGPLGALFPFQKIDNLLDPPQTSVVFPVQAILQSALAATAAVEAIALPQSELKGKSQLLNLKNVMGDPQHS